MASNRIDEISKYLEFELGIITDSKYVWSIDEANNYISNCTKNVLTLDYFEIDDRSFIDEFENQIKSKNNIYINGYSKEETLYCVINHIQKMNLKTPVYIIKNAEIWTCINKYINDSILIPYFSSDEIPAIKNNINIFIYGIDRPCTKINKIKLRRRTRSFLEDKLRQNGYSESHKLIDKTNGIFAFLKRKLFDGMSEDPEWYRVYDKTNFYSFVNWEMVRNM